jgi:hypothetical protein
MSKDREKLMLDLQRMLAAQNFQSAEEAQKFMEKLKGQPIGKMRPTTPEERAQDLVYDAREMGPGIEGDKKVFSALKLDPDCVEAF